MTLRAANRWGALMVCGLVALFPAFVDGAGPYQFYSLTPCRVADSRNPNGLSGGPALQHGVTRLFPVQGICGVPQGAKAVALNVTIVAPTGLGHLTIWPSNIGKPTVSTINFSPEESALSNGAIVPLSGLDLDLALEPTVVGNGTVHVVLDVTGYFQ